MTHLITFNSSQFNLTAETPNPINPIAGQGLLNWLREKLVIGGYEVSTPEPEDWGWYIYANRAECSYLIGASSDVEQPDPREWIVQIHRERSLIDKIFGRNTLSENDALSACIEAAIRSNQEMHEVRVERTA